MKISLSIGIISLLVIVSIANADDSSLGEQRVAVILVNFKDDLSQPWTHEFIRGIIFDNANSVNAYFKEVSYNKVSLKGDVFGWHTLPLESKVCESSGEIEKNVLNNKDIKVDYRNFDRIIIMFPRNKFCDDWDGIGNVGKQKYSTKDGSVELSITLINGRPYLDTIGHELAHNFGLNHADFLRCRPNIIEGTCSILEEGDALTITNAGATYHPNAPQKEYLKWLDKSTVQEATSKGTYTIMPIESAESGIKALKVPVSLAEDGSVREWYFLEYRQPIGFDRETDPKFYTDLFGSLIVHYNPSKTTMSKSLVLDMTPETVSGFDNALRIGKVFKDPYGGTSFSVSTSTEAKVEVNVNPSTKRCVTGKPIINVEPPTQVGRAGETLSYSLVVKNPDSCKPHIFALGLGSYVGWNAEFDSRLAVAPGETGKATIKMTPPAKTPEGLYDFNVLVEGIDGTQFGSFKGTYIVSMDTQSSNGLLIKKGWNLIPNYMFSGPLDSNWLSNSVKGIYLLDPETKKYVRYLYAPTGRSDLSDEEKAFFQKAKQGTDFYTNYFLSGTWIYSTIDTKIDQKFSNEKIFGLFDRDRNYPEYTGVRMYKGWNFFSWTPDLVGKRLNGIQGNCAVSKTVAWDNSKQSWATIDASYIVGGSNLQTISPPHAGLVLAIKVDGDCKFSSGQITAPPPPLPA